MRKITILPSFRICNAEALDMSICNAGENHSQSIGSYRKKAIFAENTDTSKTTRK